MTKVLVIEDEANIRTNILDLLEAEGFTVSGAENGAQGLQAIREGQIPHLIICDIMMPELDGFGVLEGLRQDPATSAIPFIFLTAKADRSDLRRGMELGADDFITKPFTRDELLKAIASRFSHVYAVRESNQAEFDQLKRQIGTVLAHELRTPLTSIIGYTELALEDIATRSPEQLQNFLSHVKRGSARLSQLVDDLLVLIQMDTGQVEQDFYATAKVYVYQALTEIIMKIIDSYRELARTHGLTLEITIDQGLPAVRLSQPLFSKALGHLLSNAIKFSRNRRGPIVIRVHPAGDGIDLAISDHGIGIAADAIPNLFQRFYQVNRENNEQQGSGLGLAVAQSLIGMHRGIIRVESVLGSGSTFTIHIPALI